MNNAGCEVKSRRLSVVFSMAVLLSVVMISAASTVHAASMAGVNLPDSVQVAGRTLVLNGMGLRTKYMVKVYVAGLYVEQKSADADSVIKAETPKRIVMHFVRSVTKKQITDAFDESFDANAPDAKKSLTAEINRLFGAIDSVKDGDEMAFTYVPGTGTTFAVNGQDKLTIPHPAFGQMLFSVWLGPKPPNAGLKKGLLGQ